MIFATGGCAAGATSTRSRPVSCASCSARAVGTTPSCSPLAPTRRTEGIRICSLIRSSLVRTRLRRAGSAAYSKAKALRADGPEAARARNGVAEQAVLSLPNRPGLGQGGTASLGPLLRHGFGHARAARAEVRRQRLARALRLEPIDEDLEPHA